MDRESLLVRTVQDLALAAESGDEYTLLKSSGLMRSLLLDASPLIDQVNRQRRRRITFEASAEDAYVEMVMESGPVYWFWMEGISPRLRARPGRTESLKRDQWLAKRGAVVQGRDISVKELILQVAHVEGGVHAGTPRTDLDRLLNETNAHLGVGGSGSVIRTMRGIADVVVTALRPLCPPGSLPAAAGNDA